MAKKSQPNTTTRERATVSRERRIALALRALLDAWEGTLTTEGPHRDAVEEAETIANETLNELGYGALEGVPKALARLGSELKAATDSGNYARVAELGAEMERVKAGKAAKGAVKED